MKHLHRYLRLTAFLVFIWIFFYSFRSLPMFNRSELTLFFHELQESADAALIFMGSTVLLSIFFVPLSWFIAIGAVLFGTIRGFLYSLTAATLAAIVSFLVARYLKGNLPAYFIRQIQSRRLPLDVDALVLKLDQNSLNLMFLLRNIPLVPFVAVNYLSGLASVKFWIFALGSFLGMVPGIFVSTFFFTRVVHTGTDPWGAFVGLVVKLTYIATILLIDKKIRGIKAHHGIL